MKAMAGEREVMRVTMHSGVDGNEKADVRAKLAAMVGKLMSKPSIAPPAGIREKYALHTKSIHNKWGRDALGGLIHINTDRGPRFGETRSLLRMRRGPERSTPPRLGVRGQRHKGEVGGRLDGP